MLKWYQTTFDARIQFRNPALAFLTYDDEHHRFALVDLDVIAPGGAQDGRRGLVGVDHVAYTHRSLGDLFDNYERLKAEGILPYWCIHHGVTISMYYADPDGNQMEFQVDCFATSDEANDYMAERLAANPVGVEYDPEDWLAKLRAGTPQSEFLMRKTDVPVSPIRGALGAH